jgi:uncharacterized protein with GYD domain
MAKYLTFFSYTAESVRAMIHRPSDRQAAATALVESLGGTIECFYWMQGAHDGFLISDLPDGVTGAALAAAVASTGAVGSLETHELYGHDEQAQIIEKARTAVAAYSPPTD